MKVVVILFSFLNIECENNLDSLLGDTVRQEPVEGVEHRDEEPSHDDFHLPGEA